MFNADSFIATLGHQRTFTPQEVISGTLLLKTDMCSALANVRFTPDSDRESRHPQRVMSALPPKADMCGTREHEPRSGHLTLLDHS
jgi:hypothetical protein